MKVCIINGSPKGKYSVTLQTVLYIASKFPDCEWTQIDAGQKIKFYEKDFSEAKKAIEAADFLLFSYPVYTFLAPWQLHRFIELLKEQGMDLSEKYATQISTSKHFFDVTAHHYIEQNCQDLMLKYIKGMSADMEDLLKEEGRKAAEDFWSFVCESVEHDIFEREEKEDAPQKNIQQQNAYQPSLKNTAKKSGKRVVLVTNAEKEDSSLHAMIKDFCAILPFQAEIINIGEYPFLGGCLGCLRCAPDGTCIYQDGFGDFLRSQIQTADAIVYAFTIKDHSMGASFKLYDDRQFCNGHRTMTMGMPVGYLVNGNYKKEENLRMVIEARAEVGHNYFAGVGTDQESIQKMSWKLCYALEHKYVPPQNFYGIGGMKIFRDLIYVMRGMMKADHKFYKKQGFYKDLPNKKKGQMLFMMLVGAMMSNPKLSSKMGNKMNEGMIAPYKKFIKSEGGHLNE
ncbi:MAG: NAD(P)H-dependent oxidoreductase [Roseburia sp.]|nr:NAD(P)H-dependent oxidoreductase [Roseburia sp.]MCM1278394.1 NAD(P)H-dependent oxidoreductase [Robinsoniella sp.]